MNIESVSEGFTLPLMRRAWAFFVVAVLATAVLVIGLLGCVTPIPRPAESPGPSPATEVPTPAAPTVQPTTAATPTLEPTATRRATPTSLPTPTPESPPTEASPTPTRPEAEPPSKPLLQVFAPEDGATVPGNTVAVYGQTDPGGSVEVSGVKAEVDRQGGFRAQVPLAPGDNTIPVVAANDDGVTVRVSRTVISLALPFLLLITEPENESVVSISTLPLAGRTGPNAIVSINGRSVPVNRFGYFSSTIFLEEGPNLIDVVATNDDGQTLSTVIAVIYRPPGG